MFESAVDLVLIRVTPEGNFSETYHLNFISAM